MKKRSFFASFRRLFAFTRGHRLPFLWIGLLIVASSALSNFQPKLIQMIIDRYLTGIVPGLGEPEISARFSGVMLLACIYMATHVVAFFCFYGQTLLLKSTGQRILVNIRKELYEHILHLPMSFFDTHPLGNLVTRVTNDTEAINELFTTVLTSILKNIVQFVLIVAMMFSLNATIAGLMMLLLPLIIAVSVTFRHFIRKVYQKERALLSVLNNKLSENLSGIGVIRSFHRTREITEDFDETNRAYRKAGKQEVRYFAIYRPAIEIVRVLGIAALIWFGAKGFLEGVLTFGILYAFTDYAERLFYPILSLAETYNVIQSASVSARRILDLLDEERAPEGGGRSADKLRGKIEFDHVWFAYKDEEWVLKDVSFTVEAGQFAAFVGATGAGKSTIMSLLCRFYDVSKGRILLDGVDIREYSIPSLRRAVGVVQQDVFLFSGDIIGNITLDREGVTEERAMEAARTVQADEFIQRLPGGYHETVVERGRTLSAGQRQLLAFARTLAGDPAVLVLDEATASIDTETEEKIQSAIGKLSKNRTMIAVAHRLSTIAEADRVFVLHHGELVEQGTLEELLELNGIFRVLYELQYAAAE